ncbi:NAD(P)H-hydrate dehydratase [Rhizobium sp. KVB221]|uniref:Bifunctional NAD(P)H-hydrate repair enzyme n=1 Tax=Rhizobium setariae TaxID=2801340 RepID=A0A936YU36_9HYPH|nr:NAD(P)H-hydrate dehydratase [Rhizobium setariae]MBL0372897.1 NAD(P)H-hydrate dehydratase [Rhizobium setariae]
MLIEPEAVAKIDADCIRSGIPGYALMTAAGHAVAAAALRHYPEAERFVVLAGPGNNGGDGYVAARLLAESGADIRVFRLSMKPPMTEDASRAHAECPVEGLPLSMYCPRLGDVVIDALFGAGLARDLSPEVSDLISELERNRIPVLSVDIPSGICGRSGHIRGAAFRAERTVTFVALKPGQVLLPGREHCGEVEIAEIGVPRRLIEQYRSPTRINSPDIWLDYASAKTPSGHKYSHGSLGVFSGGATQTGACRLAAEAGLRAGAGLVTIAGPSEALAANAAHLTAVMLRQVDGRAELDEWLQDRRLGAFVLGPGFGVGEKARDFVLALRDRNLVLDADGITSFRDDPERLFEAFSTGAPHLILTPHDGEFGRLFPDVAASKEISKVERAQAAARRANAIIILKGADTVIAGPDGRCAINSNAPPWLATAGSGDVLAGICGSLMAQGFAAFETACAAVWYHGEAGNRAGKGLTAESLVSHIDI